MAPDFQVNGHLGTFKIDQQDLWNHISTNDFGWPEKPSQPNVIGPLTKGDESSRFGIHVSQGTGCVIHEHLYDKFVAGDPTYEHKQPHHLVMDSTYYQRIGGQILRIIVRTMFKFTVHCEAVGMGLDIWVESNLKVLVTSTYLHSLERKEVEMLLGYGEGPNALLKKDPLMTPVRFTIPVPGGYRVLLREWRA